MSDLPLTSKQRALIRELRTIIDELGLDFETIDRYPTSEERTVHLERIRTHLIRGEVITQFTLVDDLLTHELAIEALGGHRQKPWKKDKFERFKEVLVENRASLRQKLGLYGMFRRIPNDIRESILGLNSVRNSFAHNFILDARTKPAKYRGQKILDLSAFKRFLIDQRQVIDFLLNL
jgi:hypothetical protein